MQQQKQFQGRAFTCEGLRTGTMACKAVQCSSICPMSCALWMTFASIDSDSAGQSARRPISWQHQMAALFTGHCFGLSHVLSMSAHQGLLLLNGEGCPRLKEAIHPTMLSMTATCMHCPMNYMSSLLDLLSAAPGLNSRGMSIGSS